MRRARRGGARSSEPPLRAEPASYRRSHRPFRRLLPLPATVSSRLVDVDSDVVEAFVRAPVAGSSPAVGDDARASLGDAAAVPGRSRARSCGRGSHSRSRAAAAIALARLRPLTDDEVALCRSASLHTLSSTRPSASWALAEATATTSEISLVRCEDVDLEREQRAGFAGAGRRSLDGESSATGAATRSATRRRLDERVDRSTALVYEGSGSAQSRQASACTAISQVMRWAGLGDEA